MSAVARAGIAGREVLQEWELAEVARRRMSIVRTLSEVPGLMLRMLAGSWPTLIGFITLSALIWTLGSPGLRSAVTPLLGADGALGLVWICSVMIWVAWSGQAIRSAFETVRPTSLIGLRAGVRLVLGELGHGFIMFLAIVMSFSAAALVVGAILAGMGVDLSNVSEGVDEFAIAAREAGPAAAVLMAIVAFGAFVPTLIAFVRFSAFRPAVVDRRAFKLLEPAGWSKGSSLKAMVVGLVLVVVPFAAVLVLRDRVFGPVGSEATELYYWQEAVWFAGLALCNLILLAMSVSIYRQVKPEG